MSRPASSMRVNVYLVLTRAIEEGLEYGWNRAHKHTDTPDEHIIQQEQYNAIINNICEIMTFDDEDDNGND